MRLHSLRRLAGWLAGNELFVLLVLNLIALAQPRWGVVALGLMALLWAARRLHLGYWSARTPMDWPNLGLILALPASLWISAAPALSLAQAARLLLGMGLFYAVANSAVRGWRSAAPVGVVVMGGAGLALLGLAGAAHSGSQVLGLPQRLIDLHLPFAIHANVLAAGLVLILPLAVALVLSPTPSSWPTWTRPAVAVAVLPMLVALLLTQSRGAYAGFLAAVLVMLAFHSRRGRRLAVTGCLLLAGGLALAARGFAQPLLVGAAGREAVWLRSLYAIKDFPYSGVGLGLFDRAIPILYPYFMLGTGPVAHPPHAHNLFLQVAVDMGLPGLISFLALLLAAWALLVRLHCGGDETARLFAWGLAGSLAALAVHGLVDAVAWSSKAAPLFWMLLGMLAAQVRRPHPRQGER